MVWYVSHLIKIQGDQNILTWLNHLLSPRWISATTVSAARPQLSGSWKQKSTQKINIFPFDSQAKSPVVPTLKFVPSSLVVAVPESALIDQRAEWSTSMQYSYRNTAKCAHEKGNYPIGFLRASYQTILQLLSQVVRPKWTDNKHMAKSICKNSRNRIVKTMSIDRQLVDDFH